MKPLVIIPTFMRENEDLNMLLACVGSLRRDEGDAIDILVVDDGSPEQAFVTTAESMSARWDFEVHRKEENSGFSATVNVGLQRCLDEGRDAILCNADIETMGPGWLKQMIETPNLSMPGKAAVVGGLLVFPQTGLIQHGGVYFSLLTREFNHLWKFAPMNLPEAQTPRICPVTAAFHFIRHETLTAVGLYDEGFQMGYEDVDYCIRVMLSNRECVYNPRVRAWHAESMFRGRPSPKIADWQRRSWIYLAEKYRHQGFGGLVPFV
jgi:GT2 family glycosyltransferase